MGFFSSLLPAVIGAAAGFATAGPAGAIAGGVGAAAGALTAPSTAVGGGGGTPAQLTQAILATPTGQAAIASGQAVQATQALAAMQATTGSLRRRTIVQTFNPATGAVVKAETFMGAPAVMQSDVAAANRVNRAVRRLEKKLPRRLVKQSDAARLKEEVVESALRRARDPSCPPKNC